MDKNVFIAGCTDYSRPAVDRAVSDIFAALGGADKYIKSGMTVLIKPNLVGRQTPENAATTHPGVVAALARLVQAHGAAAVIGDSPGGLFTRARLKSVYDATGMTAAAAETGAALSYDLGYSEIHFPEAAVLKNFLLTDMARSADLIINCAKLKTHVYAAFSGAVKNLFGCVPGLEKAQYHFQVQNAEQFGDLLVDLNEYIRPRINIIDAVTGMEGDGPTGGEPRHIGALIGSDSPYAADAAALRIIGLDPGNVGTALAAVKRGLISADSSDINVMGDDITRFIVDDYRMPRNPGARTENRLLNLGSRLFKPKPVFNAKKCVKCGECVRCCPAHCLVLKERRPQVKLQKCIRCFCCHEMCMYKAVKIKRSKLIDLFLK